MRNAKKRKIFLKPGEVAFGEPGTHIHTILGSCVSITLWHPHLSIGAMCHFVLPTRPKGEKNICNVLDGRYGDEAIELFEIGAKLHRTSLCEYQVKIFGGADVFGVGCNSEDMLTGERNVSQAASLLARKKIDIDVAHVGENGNRRIILDIDDGCVWVKHTSNQGKKLSSTSGVV